MKIEEQQEKQRANISTRKLKKSTFSFKSFQCSADNSVFERENNDEDTNFYELLCVKLFKFNIIHSQTIGPSHTITNSIPHCNKLVEAT